MLTGVRASHSTFLMCGTRSCAIETSTAGLSSMRLAVPISAASTSTCSLRCALSAWRTKRSRRMTPVEASFSNGGSSRARMLRPRSVATRTIASAVTPSFSISALSSRIASRVLLPSSLAR
jgi:hypothetical protein